MAHIEIRPKVCTADHRLHALIVALSGRWAVTCNCLTLDCEHPDDLHPGDSWPSLAPAVEAALRHIGLHEIGATR
jgi:hypothetical protein